MSPTLVGILAYVALQLAIGAFVSRRIHSEEDYLLAGRRMGLPLATVSLFATWFGAETCIGAAGAVYADGLAGGRADPFGYALCLVFLAAFFAIPLWRRKLTTLASLFRERFSPGVERGVSVLLVPTSVLWAAAQIRAFGQILAGASDLTLTAALLLATGVVLAYTLMGGLLADAITDAVQGAVLTVGLLAITIVAISALGGPREALAAIPLERLDPFGPPGTPLIARLDAFAVPVLGSVVAQELVARVLAARSAGVARSAPLAASALYLSVGALPVVLGLLGPALVPGLADPEQLLPALARTHLPAWAGVAFAGALVSAILSTVDSALLVAGSLTSHNVLVSLRPQTSDPVRLRWARAAVAVYAALAFGLALSAEGVYDLIVESSAFGSAGVLVCVVFGLFTRYGGRASAGLALAAGALTWTFASRSALPAPYLLSLGAALLAYLAGGVHRLASGTLARR